MPSFYTFLMTRPLGWIFKLNIYIRSLTLGIVNGFAPCGWLYVFVLASVTLKNSYQGALLMFFFWLGTVPSLTFLSYASERILNLFPKNITRIAGLILVFVGLFNLIVNFFPAEGLNKHNHTGHAFTISEKMYQEVKYE